MVLPRLLEFVKISNTPGDLAQAVGKNVLPSALWEEPGSGEKWIGQLVWQAQGLVAPRRLLLGQGSVSGPDWFPLLRCYPYPCPWVRLRLVGLKSPVSPHL